MAIAAIGFTPNYRAQSSSKQGVSFTGVVKDVSKTLTGEEFAAVVRAGINNAKRISAEGDSLLHNEGRNGITLFEAFKRRSVLHQEI